MDRLGVMLCGHGSRDGAAIREFAAVVDKLRGRLATRYDIDLGFLEFARPIIREGLDRLVARGHRRILALPAMLFAAGHVKNDICSVLNTYQAAHAGLVIEYGSDLGFAPKMLRAAGARLREPLANGAKDLPPHESLLVVVGRGTSDPDANSNIAKVMRMLWEGIGFGWGETAYSGVTFPMVEPALERAARLGYKRIVVFPYFLFTGVLVQRIYEATDAVALRHPEIDFIKAPYLNDHPLVLDTFCERIDEILSGHAVMNCQLCKYREQVLGFEGEVGTPQASHHHHVEGVGVDHHHPHGHDGHGLDHHADGAHHHGHQGQSHGRVPYPHADHPLGPRTLIQDKG
ncbi:MAG: sirohydrochlorin chelatase [Alphaproteobacteria bacterium]|nr:sirohydrochlorin chelatase [Alphaproteobacteria bacterium]